jgi:hypothetical protein
VHVHLCDDALWSDVEQLPLCLRLREGQLLLCRQPLPGRPLHCPRVHDDVVEGEDAGVRLIGPQRMAVPNRPVGAQPLIQRVHVQLRRSARRREGNEALQALGLALSEEV